MATLLSFGQGIANTVRLRELAAYYLLCFNRHNMSAIDSLLVRLAMLVAALTLGQCAIAQALGLNEAVQIAVQHNPELKLANIATATAAAAVTSANAAPNPTLTLQTMNINPSAGIGSGPLHAKTVDSSVRIDQLMERGGKRQLRTAAAELQQQAARDDLADNRRQLQRDVTVAYYDLKAAQERVEITLDAASMAERAFAAAEARRRAGDLAGTDTARLSIDALRARNDADDARADLGRAQRTFALLLGIAPNPGLAATDGWPDPHAADVGAEAAVEARADVEAARARMYAAQASRELARAGRIRDITVGVQFEHYPASIVNPQGSGNSIGVAVQIPLFVRYGMEGEIHSAEAALDAARETLEKVRLAAGNEVADASARLDSSMRRVIRYENEILPAARKSLDAGEFAFAHGASGVMDVLDVRRAWRAAQLDALTARTDFAKALAAHRAAVTTHSKQ